MNCLWNLHSREYLQGIIILGQITWITSSQWHPF